MSLPNFKTMSISEIAAYFDVGEDIPLDLIKLLGQMNASALPKNLHEIAPERRAQSVVISSKSGQIAIFYEDSLVDGEFSENPVIVQALVHYMLTDDKIFYIIPSSTFSNRENKLVFELMMPEKYVKEFLDKLTEPTTQTLSKIFRVPKEFVKKRLAAMNVTKNIAGYNY